jgi:uncharacterized protein YkwD
MSLRLPPRARRVWPQLEQLETREVLSGVQPTAAEQLMLEQLNDARADPAAYAAAIGLDLSAVASSQPLAWDPLLGQAALGHSQDMNARNYFGHFTPEGVDPGGRIAAAGYAASTYGESIAAGFLTPADALKGLITDEGIANLGHRRHLLAIDAVFRDQNAVGVGIVQGGTGIYQDYYTLDTAFGSDTRPYLTGVVYSDLNHNGKYDVGEGLGGVTVNVQGVGAIATYGSGGYSLQLNPGTYNVTFSGGGLSASIGRQVSVGAGNYRLNITSDSAPTQALFNPAETAWLTQTYQQLLGRSPGQNDFNYWLGVLARGATHDQVVASIKNSQEFRSRDDSRWLTQIYPTALGRAPGPNDFNYWLNVLANGTSRDAAAASILNSVEGRRADGLKWLPGIYQQLLGRAPRANDYDYWLGVLAGGDTHDQVIANIVNSVEFAGRLPGNTPAAWLAQVYQGLLGRQPGGGDYNYWLGVLGRGTPRVDAALQLMQSQEYRNRDWSLWVAGLYNDLLGRSMRADELQYWLGLAQGGTSRAAVINVFLSSPAYQARIGAPG